MRRIAVIPAVAALTVAGMAQAAMTVDGTLDAGYGAALWTAPASVATSTIPGAKLDAAYVTVDSGTLYVFFAGRTTVDNWPVSGRFDFVLDTGLPGMNPLTGPGIGRGNYSNFANTNGGSWHGPTFSDGFNAREFFTFALVNDWNAGYTDHVGIMSGASEGVCNFGSAGGGLWTKTGADAGAMSVTGAVNNNYTGTTGIEYAIPLADLGLDPSVSNTIKVAAWFTNNNQDGPSNQQIGWSSADAMVDPRWSGDKFGYVAYTSAVPEPTSAALLALGGLALAARRRRVR